MLATDLLTHCWSGVRLPAQRFGADLSTMCEASDKLKLESSSIFSSGQKRFRTIKTGIRVPVRDFRCRSSQSGRRNKFEPSRGEILRRVFSFKLRDVPNCIFELGSISYGQNFEENSAWKNFSELSSKLFSVFLGSACVSSKV